jgi:sigma-B regulation protein RsbU (phosphoserine phosphatase)
MIDTNRISEEPAAAAPSDGRPVLRVLLVEDNAGDVRLIRELIRETNAGFEVEVTGRLAEGCARLTRGDIALVLLDLSLPDSQGIQTFQKLHQSAPDVPVIVLSGLTNESVAVQAVHDGAQDYLVKGAGDGNLLVRSMRYALERSTVARQLARYAEELRRKNAQMEADIAMARELQLCFLPQQYPVFPPDTTPERSVIQFAHRYLPAAAVGGDFFTVLPVSPSAAGIFICDVMGHGLRAALLTAVLRGVMEELKPGASEPARFLGDVNRSFLSILRRTEETILATGFYAVLDARTGLLRYASAGHPSPFRVDRRAGDVTALRGPHDPQGPALGVFEQANYAEGRATLRDGDFLFLFTDGVHETISRAGEEFGLDRLRDVIQGHLRQPGAEILDDVLTTVQTFSGVRSFDDDVCLVGMEFAAPWPHESKLNQVNPE